MMPGRRQDDAIYSLLRRGLLLGAEDRFRPATSGSMIECVLCGATGYGVLQPGPDKQMTGRWQLAHLLPHAYRCTCGRAFLSAASWALHLYHERHDPPRVNGGAS